MPISIVSLVVSLVTACFSPPVSGATLVERFDGPPCEFCPGHRGLEFAVTRASPVVAVAAGVVTFAGSVAGVRYVVVRHDTDELLATYGMLDTVDARAQEHVRAGQRLGVVDDRLYFGLRRNGLYIDPEPYLGTVVRRARLVPIDGPSRRNEPGRLRCAGVQQRNLVVRAARSMPRSR